jgi:hypothetical protein
LQEGFPVYRPVGSAKIFGKLTTEACDDFSVFPGKRLISDFRIMPKQFYDFGV